jgi:transglutaminase-like putative cysteine protease
MKAPSLECPAIDAAHPEVQRQSAKLVDGTHGEAEKARILFEFVRDSIAYTFSWRRDEADAPLVPTAAFRASATLDRGSGMCIQKAVLLCALSRAAGLQVRLAFQSLRDYRLPRELVALMGDVLTPHGLVAIRIDGRFVRLDPSLDRSLCERKGYRLTEFSTTGDALLPSLDINGKPHFEVLEELGEFDSFPTDFVMSIFAKRFGELDVDAVRAYIARTGATM